MIRAADTLPAGGTSAYRVAIVGAGAVGIALAISLTDYFKKVVLIEAGDAEHSAEKNVPFFKAEDISDPRHPPTELYRRRMLGGTTSIWGGRCIPLDREDVDAACGGIRWPVAYEEIERHYPAALAFLDAGKSDFSAASALPGLNTHTPGADDYITVDKIERFSRPTDVWRKWGEKLTGSGSIEVIKGAACTEVVTSADGNNAEGLELKLTSGANHRITAPIIILACGGLETPRLLLASRRSRTCGLGNEHDMVGRYYMTHIVGIAGHAEFNPAESARAFDYGLTTDGIYARRLIQIPASLRKDSGVMNIVFRPTIPLIADVEHHDPVLSAMFLAKRFIVKEYALRLAGEQQGNNPSLFKHAANVLGGIPNLTRFSVDWVRRRILATRKLPSVFLYRKDGTYPLEFNAEQLPNAESRVTLGNDTDPNGVPRLSLHWRMLADESASICKAYALLEQGLMKSGLGRVHLDLNFRNIIENCILPQGGHHIGTARMGNNATEGVVDQFGEVWGTRGLFVAGAAVFPTSGFANPTLTAVALALRLAEELVRRGMVPCPTS